MAREQDGLMHRGIGMTSERTRERLIQRLREEGIVNQKVLEVIRRTPVTCSLTKPWPTVLTKTRRCPLVTTRLFLSLTWLRA